jgi:hypothetical protein
VQEYEIRVLSAGHPILIVDAGYGSDHAAVRSAKELAQDRPFEVWRSLECIYAPLKQAHGLGISARRWHRPDT